MSTLITVVVSASVGALVTAIAAMFGQFFDRRSRRRELLLTKSLEMARRHSEILLMSSKPGTKLRDEVIVAAIYYRWLEEIFESGDLPEDAKRSPSYQSLYRAMEKE